MGKVFFSKEYHPCCRVLFGICIVNWQLCLESFLTTVKRLCSSVPKTTMILTAKISVEISNRGPDGVIIGSYCTSGLIKGELGMGAQI